MESKHIQDIMEAYSSVYAQPQQEVLSEEVEQLDEITASMGRRAKKYKEDKAQAAHMAAVQQHQHNMENNPEYRERHERLRQTHSRREDQKESFDLFDYLLEYLVAEGYADTNKAALAIMANMSEEWRQSIVEGWIGQTADNVARAAGTVVGTVEKGVDTFRQKVQNVKGTFDYARDRARDGKSLRSPMTTRPTPVKPSQPPAKRSREFDKEFDKVLPPVKPSQPPANQPPAKRSREFDKVLPFGVNPGGPDFGR